jgi:rod shape-determining protein MreC
MVLIAASLLLITVYFREGVDGPVHSTRRAVLGLSAPVAEFGTIVTSPIRSVGSYLGGISVSRDRLAALETQNAELRTRLAELEEARQENERLRELVSFVEQSQLASLGARVIQRSAGSWEGVIVIDRGSEDGIEAGMPVIAAGGLVGQVAEVSGHSSRVRLITDQRSGVAAMIQSSRVLGVARGSIDGAITLGFVERTALPVPGDVVITSGLGGVYPKGIVVGQVTSVDDRRGELYPRIGVESRLDIGRLEEVLVLVGAVAEAQEGEIE